MLSLLGLLELSHFQAMTLFAFFTSLVFAFLTKQERREQAKYFLWCFLLFMLVGIGLGWLMYPFPG
jgi:cytochrome bd-type quinol oxidase subunit 2